MTIAFDVIGDDITVVIDTPVVDVVVIEGRQGPSAYEIAVANGFDGDEATWLASLEGQPGQPGGPADIAQVTHAAPTETVPDDADELPILSSATGWSLARTTFAAIKTTINTALSNIAKSQLTASVQASLGLADTAEQTTNKGQPNGYAGLDGGGKVPISQLPSTIMEYQGVWNAATNLPTLTDGTGNTGDLYRVSVRGTQTFGGISYTFEVGDYIIYNGSTWEQSDTTDAVASVAGLTGPISANALSAALNLSATYQPKIITGTCSTAATTAAKTVTLDVPWDTYTPANGDRLDLTFTLGNSASFPTLAVNSGAAKAITTQGGAVASTLLGMPANGVMQLRYNATLSTWESAVASGVQSNITAAELDAGSSGSQRYVTPNVLGPYINAKQPKIMTGTCPTATTTAAKTATLDAPWSSYTPVPGDRLLLTFTNGTTASAMTLAVNGGAPKSIMTPNSLNQNLVIAASAGQALDLRYDGSYWISPVTTGAGATVTAAELDAGANTNVRLIQPSVLGPYINAKQPKIMTGTCSTNGSSAAKTVTLDAPWSTYTPVAGDRLDLAMPNGNSSGGLTLAVNGGAAYPIATAGNLGGNLPLSVSAGGVFQLRFNGTRWETPATSGANVALTATELDAGIASTRFADPGVLGPWVKQRIAQPTETLTAGFTTVPRILATYASGGVNSGRVGLTYFICPSSATFSNITVFCGGTAAGATPTLLRFGLYSVDASGNLTLIASTPNDTTLLAAPVTSYTKGVLFTRRADGRAALRRGHLLGHNRGNPDRLHVESRPGIGIRSFAPPQRADLEPDRSAEHLPRRISHRIELGPPVRAAHMTWLSRLDRYGMDDPDNNEGHPEDRCNVCEWPIVDHPAASAVALAFGTSRHAYPAKWPHRWRALLRIGFQL